ncbi:hypothetical protein ACEPAF_3570 [Sanghuangporus sanghuang]|uniref:Uncharacterized protein n=1 Tax=Sanghuangporus baumii TaxID=108892 RepID=A0A9Q5HYW6_SANBA|nr:hypothetical protein A7U60_g4275 [Sanghuangporus baumii]
MLVLKCLVLLVLSLPTIVFAFDFSFTAPSSCDSLTISWSGGNGPFSLLITPIFNVPQNISIPDSAIDSSSGNGSFSFQLTLPPGREFLFTMSDSTGFESGGTSGVLTVGSSVSGASCNTTEPSPDFLFDANSALQQCRAFTFSRYNGAVQPVRILGLIPLGQSFELDPPTGSSSFDWIANVSNGTSIVFIMTDSQSRQGGSSNLLTVGMSGDQSCIDASSPRSTAQATSTLTGVVTATETVRDSSAKSTSNTAVIAGATIGGVAFLSVALFVSFLCFRRQKHAKYQGSDTRRPPMTFVGTRSSLLERMRNSFIPSSGRMRRAHSSFDLLPPVALHRPSRQNSPLHQSAMPIPEEEYMPNPYVLPSDASAVDGHSARASQNAYPCEPPSVYPPHDAGTPGYARSHSRSYSRSDSEPVSPFSGLSNPYSQGHARRPSAPYSVSSNGAGPRSSGKASQAGTTRSAPRLILHTDAEDVGSIDEGEEVVELPPRYTERRAPNTALDQIKGADREYS